MSTQPASYIGHDVVDDNSETIGTVTDVLYDDDKNEPKWLVVKPGALHAERFVPIERSYQSEDGDVVIPFDKKWVKEAPKAGDHIITSDVADELSEHYDVED